MTQVNKKLQRYIISSSLTEVEKKNALLLFANASEDLLRDLTVMIDLNTDFITIINENMLSKIKVLSKGGSVSWNKILNEESNICGKYQHLGIIAP